MRTLKLSLAVALTLLPALSFADPTVTESTLIDEAEIVSEGKSAEELVKAHRTLLQVSVVANFQILKMEETKNQF